MMFRPRTEHPYWLWESIMGTPEILRFCLEDAVEKQVKHAAERILARAADQVFFVGTGSSGWAGLADAYAFEHIAGIPSSAHITSELGAYPPLALTSRSVVIATSHSGRTPGDLAAIELARERGAHTIGITDIADSPLAQAVDDTIIGPGGPKAEMPATRTYDAAMFRVFQLAIVVRQRAEGESSAGEFAAQLNAVPGLLRELLDGFASKAPQFVSALADCSAFFVIGAGPNMATVYEGALALLQSTGGVATGFQVEEFLHGPVQAMNDRMCLVAVAAPGPLSKRIGRVARAARIIGAKILVLAPQDSKALGEADLAIAMPGELSEWLTPLLYIAPFWQIGYHFSLRFGRDPDVLSMHSDSFKEAIASLMPQGSKFDALVERKA